MSPAAVLLLAALSAGLQTPRRPLANPSVSHVALHERLPASAMRTIMGHRLWTMMLISFGVAAGNGSAHTANSLRGTVEWGHHHEKPQIPDKPPLQ